MFLAIGNVPPAGGNGDDDSRSRRPNDLDPSQSIPEDQDQLGQEQEGAEDHFVPIDPITLYPIYQAEEPLLTPWLGVPDSPVSTRPNLSSNLEQSRTLRQLHSYMSGLRFFPLMLTFNDQNQVVSDFQGEHLVAVVNPDTGDLQIHIGADYQDLIEIYNSSHLLRTQAGTLNPNDYIIVYEMDEQVFSRSIRSLRFYLYMIDELISNTGSESSSMEVNLEVRQETIRNLQFMYRSLQIALWEVLRISEIEERNGIIYLGTEAEALDIFIETHEPLNLDELPDERYYLRNVRIARSSQGAYYLVPASLEESDLPRDLTFVGEYAFQIQRENVEDALLIESAIAGEVVENIRTGSLSAVDRFQQVSYSIATESTLANMLDLDPVIRRLRAITFLNTEVLSVDQGIDFFAHYLISIRRELANQRLLPVFDSWVAETLPENVADQVVRIRSTELWNALIGPQGFVLLAAVENQYTIAQESSDRDLEQRATRSMIGVARAVRRMFANIPHSEHKILTGIAFVLRGLLPEEVFEEFNSTSEEPSLDILKQEFNELRYTTDFVYEQEGYNSYSDALLNLNQMSLEVLERALFEELQHIAEDIQDPDVRRARAEQVWQGLDLRSRQELVGNLRITIEVELEDSEDIDQQRVYRIIAEELCSTDPRIIPEIPFEQAPNELVEWRAFIDEYELETLENLEDLTQRVTDQDGPRARLLTAEQARYLLETRDDHLQSRAFIAVRFQNRGTSEIRVIPLETYMSSATEEMSGHSFPDIPSLIARWNSSIAEIEADRVSAAMFILPPGENFVLSSYEDGLAGVNFVPIEVENLRENEIMPRLDLAINQTRGFLDQIDDDLIENLELFEDERVQEVAQRLNLRINRLEQIYDRAVRLQQTGNFDDPGLQQELIVLISQLERGLEQSERMYLTWIDPSQGDNLGQYAGEWAPDKAEWDIYFENFSLARPEGYEGINQVIDEATSREGAGAMVLREHEVRRLLITENTQEQARVFVALERESEQGRYDFLSLEAIDSLEELRQGEWEDSHVVRVDNRRLVFFSLPAGEIILEGPDGHADLIPVSSFALNNPEQLEQRLRENLEDARALIQRLDRAEHLIDPNLHLRFTEPLADLLSIRIMRLENLILLTEDVLEGQESERLSQRELLVLVQSLEQATTRAHDMFERHRGEQVNLEELFAEQETSLIRDEILQFVDRAVNGNRLRNPLRRNRGMLNEMTRNAERLVAQGVEPSIAIERVVLPEVERERSEELREVRDGLIRERQRREETRRSRGRIEEGRR